MDSAIQKISQKRTIKIGAVVGAGISKASGMPTFRGEEGLWNQYSAQELANPTAFQRDPKLVWNWYKFRMKKLLEAKPNPAHDALVKLEKKNLLLGIITQNVDGLHEIAGNTTEKLIEIHGRIRYARCTNCSFSKRWDNKEFANDVDKLPYCPKCKDRLIRPDVVWFGESLDPFKIEKAMNWLNNCNVLLIIGTSGVVYPVASFPTYAKQQGATLIEFNIEKTPLTSISDFSLIGPSERLLPKFVEKITHLR